MISAAIVLSTTYQKLSDLLNTAGITGLSNNSVTSESGYILNRDSAINISVASGFSGTPTGTQAVVTPLAAILFNAGMNLNTTWIKSASSTPTIEFVEGASAYENASITGVIGTITLTDNTVPKGSSNNLVNSAIVDNGTTVAISEPITSTGAITTTGATATSGYATGAGSAVSQGSSRTTTVTLSKPCGAITLFSAAGSATPATFQVTNTLVTATDTIVLSQKSGTDAYGLYVTTVAAGSFKITVVDLTGTTTEAPVVNFAVVKAVAS